MRTHSLFAALAFVLFATGACNRSLVSLDYTNAKDEVPGLANLVFRFSQPLVADSLVNRWDSTEYIRFSPAIPGKFRWEHPDELVFSPSRPLKPATAYTAAIQDDVLRFSKYGRVGGSALNFHTAPLAVEGTTAAWVLPDESSRLAVPQVEIQFNYAVDPAGLKDKLAISSDGAPVNFQLQTLSASNRIQLRLTGVKMEDRDYPLNLTIDKGLTPQEGSVATADPLRTNVVVPSPYLLRVNDVVAEQEAVGGVVRITTTQAVAAGNLASWISIEPAVKFTAEPTDDGLAIRSEQFNGEKTYTLKLKKGLTGRIGGVLHEDYATNIAFGEIEPSISFDNSKGIYLSAQGEKNISVTIANVPSVKLTISKIYENNLLTAAGYQPDDGSENEYSYDNGSTAGDVIYSQTVETISLPKYGNARVLHLDFADKLPEFKGIYHIQVRSTKDYWVRDSRFLSMTDIGLIVREGADRMLVFANSIKNAAALPGVNVTAYGANNQVLATGSTSADGVAELTFKRREFAGFKPAMVIAKTEGDFNYLLLKNTRVNTSRFDVGGKTLGETGLDAFVYPERDIYRPGETINFSAVLRDNRWKSPGEIPVKFKFLLPNGKELKSFRKTLNEEGSTDGSIPLDASAITGSYSLELLTSNDVLLNTQTFRVEEFVPDRIRVDARLDNPTPAPGSVTRLAIKAENFFGPPAAGRNYECELQVKPDYFHPKKYASFDFSLSNSSALFDKTLREGKTDDKGTALETFTIPDLYKNLGLLEANFYTTVFDETGRPVSRLTTAQIHTQPVYFGVADDGNWYYALNQPIRFPVIAVGKNEQATSAPATIEVVKHEYRTVLAKSGSYFRYESQKQDKLVASQVLTVSGENYTYAFTPRSPGEYELRVSVPGANSYVRRSFYSYGYGFGGDNSSFEVNNEGQVDIQPDKESYETGESAKLLFKAPFDGRMLVTFETDRTVSYQFVNVDKRTAIVDTKLSGAMLPNVYVTATLIKPHGISEIPLTVAHGFRNLTVTEARRKMAVSIVAAKSVHSRTHQTVTVKAAPNARVTLAAVDNGVLQVSAFATPDPYGYFYARRALGVEAYDIYPLLLPELKARLSSTGGDSEADMNKRTNPMPAKRIKILSYWSGIRKTDGSGEARFEFDVPQFSGEVRLMAVAYKDDQFGSAEEKMTVADPLVLSTALPRFLTPADSVTVPVTITNTTGKPAEGKATVTTTGGIRISGESSQSFSIPATGEKRLYFTVMARPEMGTGKLTVAVTGSAGNFTDETEISVRPSAGLQKFSGSGQIEPGATVSIPFQQPDLIPASVQNELVVSRFPATSIAAYLNNLVLYPYGCTEQTVSIAFPQLYYGDMADAMHLHSALGSGANANVQEAIRKIKMRQLYNGAVTLWDGEGTENWWTTVYAAHFLVEAGKAGFDVDRSLVETMLGYVNAQLRDRKTIQYFYNRNQQRKIVPKEVIYGLYVLALANKPNVSVMNYYKANPSLLSLDCKYLLAAAYALAGDKAGFRQMLPSSFQGEEAVAETGGSFSSDIRDEAMALDVLIDVDPANAQIPEMARQVSEKMRARTWYSTQELSFGFLSLGKLARQAARSTATADILVSGKTIATAGNADAKLNTAQLRGHSVDIRTSGSGRMYYYWTGEGISVTGRYKDEDRYLKVRKRFFDRFGHAIEGNSFKQNDLVIVELKLEKSYSGDVNNVVVTDMLPAGFEIENPRTKDIPGMDWIKSQSSPTALDVRDDRINLFVDATENTQTYYYAVRAVSPGVYRMGPVSADAMYNGEYHSMNGAGTIVVHE